jgi:hypothetical protein
MYSKSPGNLLFCLMTLVAGTVAFAQSPAPAPAAPTAVGAELRVARIDSAGKLLKPADLSTWVFLGASLGMGYNPGSFNAARPGQFQVVLMEPTAYRHFVERGSYAPGSMFLLSFYDPDQRRSINQNGFVQAGLTNYEIHLLDTRKGEERHAFFMFGPNDTAGDPVPKGNACVTCHVKHGAFDGTFAQFYPTIRHLIPPEALKRALENHDIR